MYPREQLTILERHKSTLRMRITAQRWEAVQHMERVMRPVGVLNRVYAKWQSLPVGIRMATGPIALFLQRTFWKRSRIGGTAVMWGPVIWRFAKWALPLIRQSSYFSSTPGGTALARVRKFRRRRSAA